MNRFQWRSRQDEISRAQYLWYPWILPSAELVAVRHAHDRVMDSIYRSLGVPPELLAEFADAVTPPAPPRSGQDRAP